MIIKNGLSENFNMSAYTWNKEFSLSYIDLVYLRAFETGCTNRDLADFFKCGRDWVDTRAAKLKTKLGFKDRVDLVNYFKVKNCFSTIGKKNLTNILRGQYRIVQEKLTSEEAEFHEEYSKIFTDKLLRDLK